MAILRGHCTVKQIEDIVMPAEPFGPGTTPSKSTVERWIDEDIDLLTPQLRAAGIVVPVVDTETKNIVAIVQSKRVSARIVNLEHFDHGPLESPYAGKLNEEAGVLLNQLLNEMKLPYEAVTKDRKEIPQTGIFDTRAETWTISQEDSYPRDPIVRMTKEF
jgi:hypothetical protein